MVKYILSIGTISRNAFPGILKSLLVVLSANPFQILEPLKKAQCLSFILCSMAKLIFCNFTSNFSNALLSHLY